MTGLMVHLDLSGSTDAGSGFKNSDGNYKHKRFLKSRRFLERKGYLNNKQNKTQQKPKSCPNGKIQQKPKSCPNGKIQHQQNHKGPKPLRSSSKRAAEARKPARAKLPPPIAGASCSHTKKPKGAAVKASVPHSDSPSKYLAIDCEMVGTGPNGNNSELARCSIVSYDGDVLYDKFIKPVHKVTNLRTRWSGIRWQHLRKATPFLEAKKEILKILSGKVVVGHALHNDLKALKYSHPAGLTRDTSRIPLLNKKAGIPVKDVASLKRLTKAILNRDIQNGHNGHSSVEDAQATMDLFKTVAVEWEKKLAE